MNIPRTRCTNDSAAACIYVTDTVPLSGTAPTAAPSKLHVLSVAPMLAEAIGRIHDNRSVSALFRRDDPGRRP